MDWPRCFCGDSFDVPKVFYVAPDEVGLGGEVVVVHQQKSFLLLNGFDFFGGEGGWEYEDKIMKRSSQKVGRISTNFRGKLREEIVPCFCGFELLDFISFWKRDRKST